jgi:hypothetical protein
MLRDICSMFYSVDVPQMRSRFLRGQYINRLCASLRHAHARQRFYFSEDEYCLEFGLDREERQAVKDRDFATLVTLGAHVVELDALAALSGLSTLEAIRLRRGLRNLDL